MCGGVLAFNQHSQHKQTSATTTHLHRSTRGKSTSSSAKKKEVVREAVPAEKQMSLFDIYPADHPVLKELAELDVSNMTPIQALNTLYELQKRLKETN